MIEENKKKRFSKIAIPSCLIILIVAGCIIMFTNDDKKLKDNNTRLPEYENKIIINNLDNFDNPNVSIAGGTYDIAGGFYEKAIDELKDEYPFINHLFIFDTNTKNQRIGEYRYDAPDINYRGYYVLYTDATETKGIEIFFSKTMNMKPRDIGPLIVLEELNDSKIMNTQVKIIESQNQYIAFFDKNDIHFDIEANGISQDQLINLIEAILKN